ncbi:MAG TPA: CARDB domain-containing protein [Thermoanaerobaculia bacterium]|nr:CARDB domain-containing protein [Thermoanaerobaculia bacterium]
MFLFLTLPLAGVLPGGAQAAKPSTPGLLLEAMKVDPASPGKDTLCKLSVTIRNAGSKTASALGFRVKVDGKELAVYGNELFFRPIAAGATAEVKLHNFWTNETGRPFPSTGKMTVEATLTEARWMDVKTENGVEIWTPVGPIEGLPVSKSIALTLKR